MRDGDREKPFLAMYDKPRRRSPCRERRKIDQHSRGGRGKEDVLYAEGQRRSQYGHGRRPFSISLDCTYPR